MWEGEGNRLLQETSNHPKVRQFLNLVPRMMVRREGGKKGREGGREEGREGEREGRIEGVYEDKWKQRDTQTDKQTLMYIKKIEIYISTNTDRKMHKKK